MVNRCQICGIASDHVSVCNYCTTAGEEQKFFKMVTREEFRDSQLIKPLKKIASFQAAARKKNHKAFFK